MNAKYFTAAFSLILSLLLAGPPLAAEVIYLGQRSAPTQLSFDAVSHSGWHQLLQKYVDSDGMVDYRSWHRSSESVARLDQYLNSLSAADPQVRASREGRLAFWVNAYNAVTIRGILREYPTSSIRNHTAKLFGYNIWKQLQLYIGGEPYSLDAIEHQVLRKMEEPRIHFAIVCASKGCPRLLNEAYVSQRVDEQLNRNAVDFFQRRANFRYDVSANTFHLSAILKWFATDFGANRSAQLQRIAPWLPQSAQRAAMGGQVRVAYLSYDWSLNEQNR